MSLNIAASALTTNQSVLQVIGHNIANVNTVGYSRQSVSLSALEGAQKGAGIYGQGVNITEVSRSYDAFLARQANTTQTLASAQALRYEKLQQVESLFPLGSGSLGTMVNSALNAWVDVQSSPSDSTARQVVINRAEELVTRIRDTATRLGEIGDTAKIQSTEVGKSINQKAEQIASLNNKISRAMAGTGAPNELLDQRDKLVADLGKQVQVSTLQAEDGTMTVFVANSYPLVLGSTAAQIQVEPDPLDANRQVVNFVLGETETRIRDDLLVGGELKGLQTFINQDLPNTQAELGRLALALASGVNEQHNSGLNQSGAAGGDFFTVSLKAVPDDTPPGLTIDVSDHTALAASDYEMTFTGANTASVKRLSDGVEVATSSGLPLTFDGLTITQAAGATAGSKFLLRPAADAARTLDVAISRPADLAVASTVGISPGATNTGRVSIEAVSQSVTPAGALPIAIAFNAAGQISLAGGAFQAFTPGKPMAINGFSLTLRGTPSAADSFTIDTLPAGAEKFNGGNAQAMLALRDAVTFDGSATLADGYVSVFSSVASRVSESKFAAEFSQAQAAAAETQRANQAGVNLDEEAAKLIQYQQAYQASAKYMGTVQSMFDTLLSSFH